MEHLLIQGGEQYLPFARSCIAKLKRLGLPYASQSYEVDGASIKVRIEPGHEYITLKGSGTLGWRLLPSDEKSPHGYVIDPDSPMPDGTYEQVPYRAEDLGEPGEDEDVDKTRNPFVFVTPSALIREETTVVHGDYVWSDGKQKRLLFGVPSHSFAYQQRRMLVYAKGSNRLLLADSGALARSGDKKYVVLAVRTDRHTEFFVIPFSRVRGAKDLAVLDDAVKIGTGPEMWTGQFRLWRFSPDGMNAIALEGETFYPPSYHEETEFLKHTDGRKNSWTGVQHIHRASLEPVDGDEAFTVTFTKETREGAVLKSVPTTTFVCKEMRRDLEIFPSYAVRADITLRHMITDARAPFNFSASAVDGGELENGDPRLAGPYPTNFRIKPILDEYGYHVDAPGVVPGPADSVAKLYSVFDAGASPEKYIGDGVLATRIRYHPVGGVYYVGVPLEPREYYGSSLVGVQVLCSGDEANDALDTPEFRALDASLNDNEILYNSIRDTVESVTRGGGAPRLPPYSLHAIHGEVLKLRYNNFPSVGSSSTIHFPLPLDNWDNKNLYTRMSAYITRMEVDYVFPYNHSVTTHWERKTTFHYEGRRVIGVDYKRDGTETLLELVGRPDEKVTYLFTDKTLTDPSRPDETGNDGTLECAYTVSGGCGYSLLLDGEVVVEHVVNAEARRSEFFVPLEQGQRTIHSSAPQQATERAFSIEGYDLRNGILLTRETVRIHSDQGGHLEGFYETSPDMITGRIVCNDELVIYTKKGGRKSLLKYDERVLRPRGVFKMHGAGVAHYSLLTAIVTGSRRGESAEEFVPINGVMFTKSDFGENTNLPTEEGRIKFQQLLPSENRDVSGELGEYRGKNSSGWYRVDQAINSETRTGVARVWMFHEVAVISPGPSADFSAYPIDEEELQDYYVWLYALTPEKWLVMKNPLYGFNQITDPPDIAIIGNGKKVTKLSMKYIDEQTAKFRQVSYVA